MPKIIEPPRRARHRFGLFSVADVRPAEAHDTFGTGVEWAPNACEHPGLWQHECPVDPDVDPPAADRQKCLTCQPLANATARPITVYGAYQCPLVGVGMAEAQRRAEANLLDGEEHSVERAVMAGLAGANPSLSAADTTYAGQAGCAAELLELLHTSTDPGFIGEPVFHIPRAAIHWLFGADLLEADGDVLRTKLGTPVAAGSGYTEANVGPPANPGEDPRPPLVPGAWWVYATGPVVALRGDVQRIPTPAEQGFNPRTNDYTALAERAWVVGWECLTVAALFNPGCPT